jgi:hypothetical protein
MLGDYYMYFVRILFCMDCGDGFALYSRYHQLLECIVGLSKASYLIGSCQLQVLALFSCHEFGVAKPMI